MTFHFTALPTTFAPLDTEPSLTADVLPNSPTQDQDSDNLGGVTELERPSWLDTTTDIPDANPKGTHGHHGGGEEIWMTQ